MHESCNICHNQTKSIIVVTPVKSHNDNRTPIHRIGGPTNLFSFCRRHFRGRGGDNKQTTKRSLLLNKSNGDSFLTIPASSSPTKITLFSSITCSPTSSNQNSNSHQISDGFIFLFRLLEASLPSALRERVFHFHVSPRRRVSSG